ncbi:hypothetical protein [Streptomyces violaceusniger]|uniref:hypothetical protein n=1 Tax=Streptomyces violaceusniger TaxID=68280 RepID=UPI0001E4BB40|nr:hypothetical protein [Streptomyces violaceusniger]
MRDDAAALPAQRDRAKGTALRAPVADCFYRPGASPHFIVEPDRAATPCVAAIESRKHELGRAEFQVRSSQAIQREPPVVSDVILTNNRHKESKPLHKERADRITRALQRKGGGRMLKHPTELPDRHADALRVAFGLAEGTPDPFRIGLAALGRLAAAAQARPRAEGGRRHPDR